MVEHANFNHFHPSRTTSAVVEAIEKYSEGLADLSVTGTIIMSKPRDDPTTVLLTGSTGNLGSHILASLLQDDRVACIFAHNRPSKVGETIMSRQRASFEAQGLNIKLLESAKLVLIEGDLTQVSLGLSDEVFAKVL